MNFNRAVEYIIYSVQNIAQFIDNPQSLINAFKNNNIIVDIAFYNQITDLVSKQIDLKIIREFLINNTPRRIDDYDSLYKIQKMAHNLVNGTSNSSRHQIILNTLQVPNDIGLLINKYDVYFYGQTLFTLDDDSDKNGNTIFSLLSNNRIVTKVNEQLIVWNLTTQKQEFKIRDNNSFNCLKITSLSNDRVFIPNCNTSPSIWNLQTYKKDNGPDVNFEPKYMVIDTFPDGRFIIKYKYENYNFQIWNSSKDKADAFFCDENHNDSNDIEPRLTKEGPVSTIKILSNNRVAIARVFIEIWDLKEEYPLYTLGFKGGKRHRDEIIAIEQLSNDRLLSIDCHIIKIWNLKTQDLICNLDSKLSILSFLLDNERLIVGYSDSSIKIWDLNTGKVIASIRSKIDNINFMKQYSKEELIMASKPGMLGMFNLNTYTFRYDFESHDNITQLEVLPNGNVIIASKGGIIKVLK